MLKDIKKIIILIFLGISISTTYANVGPFYQYTQGGNALTHTFSKDIKVEILDLKITTTDETNTGTANKLPGLIELLLKKGISKDKINSMIDNLYLSILGYHYSSFRSIDKLEGKKEINYDTNFDVTYTFKNNSNKIITGDFAFYPLTVNDFNEEFFTYCDDYESECKKQEEKYNALKKGYIVFDEEKKPLNLKIYENNKDIKYNQTYYNNKVEYNIYTLEDSNKNGIKLPLLYSLDPIYKFNLSFNPGEVKKIRIVYDTKKNDRVISRINYYFSPIYTWGDGVVPKVNLVINYPYGYDLDLGKNGQKYLFNTNEENEIKYNDISDNGKGYTYKKTYNNMDKLNGFNNMFISFDTDTYGGEYNCIFDEGINKSLLSSKYSSGYYLLNYKDGKQIKFDILKNRQNGYNPCKN